MDEYLTKPLSSALLGGTLARLISARSGSGSSDGPNAASLDPEKLDELRQLSAPGQDFLAEAAEVFLDTLPDAIERIRSAAQRSDATELGGQAHSLKSSSAYLGATELSSICATLQDRGDAADLSDSMALVARLELEAARAERALRELVPASAR